MSQWLILNTASLDSRTRLKSYGLYGVFVNKNDCMLCFTPLFLKPCGKYIQFSGALTGFPGLLVLEVVTVACMVWFLRLFRMAWILKVSCGST